MFPEKVYVLLQYPNQPSPVVAYSRSLDHAPENAWQDAADIIHANLNPAKYDIPLVTVYASSGLVPEDAMSYRWGSSPPGMDVLHLGNLALV
jgi:hypothetical protein